MSRGTLKLDSLHLRMEAQLFAAVTPHGSSVCSNT